MTGALPPGLAFDAVTGELSGTPTIAGDYAFALTASNSVGAARRSATVTITATEPAAVVATPTPSPPPATIPGSTAIAFSAEWTATPVLLLILGALLIAAGVAIGAAHTILRRRALR